MANYNKLKHVRISEAMETSIEQLRLKQSKKLNKEVSEAKIIRSLISKALKSIESKH